MARQFTDTVVVTHELPFLVRRLQFAKHTCSLFAVTFCRFCFALDTTYADDRAPILCAVAPFKIWMKAKFRLPPGAR
jgi:hypothetical protein